MLTLINNNTNPHALDEAQSPSEVFEIMEPPCETFDPYKDKPVSTNLFTTRADAHKEGLWHCSVHVWIVKSPSLVLLQKRSLNKDTFPGRWDISSAGHIEAGKTALEAAYAEVAEELGVDLKSSKGNGVFNGGLQYAFVIPAEQAPLGGCNAFEHVYFLQLNDNTELKLSLGTEEVTDVCWIESKRLVESLRNDSTDYAPRSRQYADAMENYINNLFRKTEDEAR